MSDFDTILALLEKYSSAHDFQSTLLDQHLDVNARSQNTGKLTKTFRFDNHTQTITLGSSSPIVIAIAVSNIPSAMQVAHKLGADVNATDGSDRCTALIWACRLGHTQMCRMLVFKLGAKLQILDVYNQSAVYYASHTNTAIACELIRKIPGSMSLRRRGSNHILKPSHMSTLLKQRTFFDVSLNNYAIIRDMLSCTMENHNALPTNDIHKVVNALWDLEQTRFGLKRDAPLLYEHLSQNTEVERFEFLYCFESTKPKHRLADPNMLRIIIAYI